MGHTRAFTANAGRLCAAVSCLLFADGVEANAQQYPSRSVRLIIPSTMGGPLDVVARALAGKLSETIGQQVKGENRAGAGGAVGAEIVAKAAPDGHTLLIASNSLVTNAAKSAKGPLDPVADFSPVSLVAQVPSVLVVHPSLPVKSVKDLVAFARARPHELLYASAGGGSNAHLAALLFCVLADVRMTHVPYRGGRLGLLEVMGGQVPLTFANTIVTLPQVSAGRLRALAVTTARRSPAAPELPTMQEGGVDGYEATAWFALMAPAGTPTAVVNQINTSVAGVMRTPEVRTRLGPLGAETAVGSPAELAQHIRAEFTKWEKVIRVSGPLDAGGDER
jgi:tripartite-type tricarboxylate transporter receptor subunit TctC